MIMFPVLRMFPEATQVAMEYEKALSAARVLGLSDQHVKTAVNAEQRLSEATGAVFRWDAVRRAVLAQAM